MRILVVGQGAREHALCWKLKQSPLVREVYAAPGNAGIAQVADIVPIGVADIVELADFAEKLKMDLTIVGPELPLTIGIVDEFQKRGLPIFGPTRLAAELEGSKVFSKEFMRKYGIPTAEAFAANSVDEAKKALKHLGYPAVLKVDGLAAGKGVVIVQSASEADEYLRTVFEEKKFGIAPRILVEEFLTGEEVSFMVVTDGKKSLPLAPAKDYKKAFDNDQGPNTGGMGAHSPAVVLSGETGAEIMKSIIVPTIQGMEAEGRPYTGVLFAGLMLTPNGPKVLEYNCRFGDPETQVQILRLEDDLADICLRVARGSLGDLKTLNWLKEAAACVVIAVDGYPDEYVKGQEVVIDPIDDPAVVVFHAGVVKRDGKLVNQAGRVVSVCARAATLSEALAKAYEAAPKIRFEGARYRRDIGYRALEARAASS
ncbi:MAG: phosphoribosylamine--glycine ligase [Acidobacteriota bacterium]